MWDERLATGDRPHLSRAIGRAAADRGIWGGTPQVVHHAIRIPIAAGEARRQGRDGGEHLALSAHLSVIFCTAYSTVVWSRPPKRPDGGQHASVSSRRGTSPAAAGRRCVACDGR